MAFHYREVVPWGRSYDEYRSIFALDGVEPGLALLGCGDGPAAFNAELTRRGGRIRSVDPLYCLSRSELELRIEQTREQVIAQPPQFGVASKATWRFGGKVYGDRNRYAGCCIFRR